jgi:hypothetical protein
MLEAWSVDLDVAIVVHGESANIVCLDVSNAADAA